MFLLPGMLCVLYCFSSSHYLSPDVVRGCVFMSPVVYVPICSSISWVIKRFLLPGAVFMCVYLDFFFFLLSASSICY